MTAGKIEWTDRHDWNPLRGCSRVSPGCGGPGPHGGCYAEAMAARFSDPGQWGHGFATRVNGRGRWTGKVELQEDRLTLPLRWRKPALGQNKAFPSSTSDIWHELLTDAEIDRILAVMALAQDWIFQPLTKRSERMWRYLTTPGLRARLLWTANAMAGAASERQLCAAHSAPWPLPNVWLGVSVEDQQRADERIPYLLATPAAVRWLSCEPLLGPVDLTRVQGTIDQIGERPVFDALAGMVTVGSVAQVGGISASTPRLDWIVAGLESGPDARFNDGLTNMRSLLAQCRAADVPFFGKQGFKKQPVPDDLNVREFPAEAAR